jgi:hypothetical protein
MAVIPTRRAAAAARRRLAVLLLLTALLPAALLLISTLLAARRRPHRPRQGRQAARTVCLAHTDVLLLLVLALAFASWCSFRIIAGAGTWPLFFFFVLQALFCMITAPTLSIALRLPPSTFLAQYVRSAGASWLLKAVLAVMLTQTLLVLWHL